MFDASGELLGDIQLPNIDWRHRTATLGCGLALQEDRGHRHCTDAACTLRRFAFELLDLARINTSAAEHSRAAQGVLEEVGFQEEGRSRQAIYADSQRWDKINHGLLRSEPHSPPI